MKLHVLGAMFMAAAATTGVQNARGQCACDGDLNQDGVVNIIDVLDAYECAVGAVPPSDPQCDLADVNCDGVMDTCDMSRAYCYFIGQTNCCETTVCGACCNEGTNFNPCEVVSEEQCVGLTFNGSYLGDGVSCDPNPCECLTDADCDDGNVCTVDACGPDNSCIYTPVADGTACNDGLYCTVGDACMAGECSSEPRVCNDGILCTEDSCSEVGDQCVFEPIVCDHDGVCEPPCETTDNCQDDCPCTATRDLSDGGLVYCPNRTKTVRIALHPPAETFALGVEDAPPSGWVQVDNISDGGVYDADNHKVKWGPFFDPFPAELTYDVVPPDPASGAGCFDGTASVDGVNEPTCGDECIEELCCAFMPADELGPVCDGCADCTCATCGDNRVELCEMIGYACAWKSGCNDDLAAMTRAAFIWVTGECYCWDEAQANWFSVPCSGVSACCEGGAKATVDPRPVRGTVTLSQSTIKGERSGVRSRTTLGRAVSIEVQAPDEAMVMAIECQVPKGMRVDTISSGGAWDSVSRKVKWGPFFDHLSRTVTFQIRGSATATRLAELSGTVAFDGIEHTFVIR